MPVELPPEVQALITIYTNAQAKLINIIVTQSAKGNVVHYQKEVLDGVNAELAALNKYAEEWVSNTIPAAYNAGTVKAYNAYKKAGVPFFPTANRETVQMLIENVTGQLTEASRYVGRRIADEVRQAGVEAVAEKMSMGATVKETKARLLQKLSDNGIAAITDKNGRNINLDAYASTVARTTTREATNKGTMNAVTDVGGDLVKMSQHFSSCEVCAVYEGRVYSISGNDKRYPPLDEAFSGEYAIIHPNCTHNLMPYFEDMDDDADKLREESNRPFKVDPDKKASIAQYNKEQAVKMKRNNDRRQYEDYKLRLGTENTPKTFSGFRAAKRANGDKWMNLQDDYKAIGAKIKQTISGTINRSSVTTMRGHIDTSEIRRIAPKTRAEMIAKTTSLTATEAKDAAEAITNYTAGGYKLIRRAQTSTSPILPGSALETYVKQGNAIEDFIKYSPKWDGSDIYRGVGLSDEVLSGIKKGATLDMNGISSWSSTMNSATKFAAMDTGNRNVIFEVSGVTKNATSIRHLSVLPDENEVLMSNNAQFTVKRIVKSKTGLATITLDMI